MSTRIVMGPVLSFRGMKSGGRGKALWQVSALVMVPTGGGPVTLVRDGQASNAVLLASTPAGDVYRHDLSVTLGATERRVVYEVADAAAGLVWPQAQRWSFTVPASDVVPRLAYFSCNGFSDPKLMKELKAGASAVWADLVHNHDQTWRPADYVLDREQQWHETESHAHGWQRFHVGLAGGDQVYVDGIWSEMAELKDWTELEWGDQLRFKPSATLVNKIKAYYWSLYATRWAMDVPTQKQPDRHLGAGLAFATLPMVMMWDDHDILDGWGSYSARMQKAPLMQAMFAAAREAFWVCQLQMPLALLPTLSDQNPEGAKDPRFAPVDWAMVRKQDVLSPAFLDGQPAFNHQLQLGEVSIAVMDLRTERSQQQIMGSQSWSAWQSAWQALSGASHVLLMSSVPVAHPKMSLIEKPLSWFASDSVTDSNADDLNDHWSHDKHEDERKRLVRTLVALGEQKRCRVTLLSGDVHVAAWGMVGHNVLASNGQRVNQFTSSAIVHPSLSGFVQGLFLKMLNAASEKPQVIDAEHTVTMMTFPGASEPMMPARNWLALELDAKPRAEYGNARRLWASWRTEQPDGFRNHLVAVHPYRLASVPTPAPIPDEPVAAVAASKRDT